MDQANPAIFGKCSPRRLIRVRSTGSRPDHLTNPMDDAEFLLRPPVAKSALVRHYYSEPATGTPPMPAQHPGNLLHTEPLLLHPISIGSDFAKDGNSYWFENAGLTDVMRQGAAPFQCVVFTAP